MVWEIRISQKANRRLREIPRDAAIAITDGIDALSKMPDPRQGADFIEDTEDDKLNHPAYAREYHVHFVKFELREMDGRNVLKILDIE
ncbi:hypothetical protein KFU94_00180 [Chloroflexi bacterium TSY]|nr:hypothetical protein [Chloroflexi bacterium TSY]